MKLFGSLKELVAAVFRKNGQEITLRPNQSTTYTSARDIQLPPLDADEKLVGEAAAQTLLNNPNYPQDQRSSRSDCHCN